MTAENAQIRRLQRSHTSNPTDIANSVRLRAIERRTNSNWPPVNVFDTAPANTLFVFLGIISKPKDLGRWAIDALMSGFDTPSLRVLASIAYTDSTQEEAHLLREQVFAELILPEPTANLIERLVIVEPKRLQFINTSSSATSDVKGTYGELLQFVVKAQRDSIDCMVNRLGETDPAFLMDEHPIVFEEFEYHDDYCNSSRLKITHCPAAFAKGKEKETLINQTITFCIRVYLVGRTTHQAMTTREFLQILAQS